MDNILNKIQGIVTECCITISLNTHRTAPDNRADVIVLKNLISVAKKTLLAEYKDQKHLVIKLNSQLDKLSKSIDHSMNLESLILFVNEDIATYTRLAVNTINQVMIGNRFVIRDIVRAEHADMHYYILVLSMREVRLIEAFDNRPIEELNGIFPIINKDLHAAENKVEQANAVRQTSLQKEFLNKIDKELNKAIKANPLPVVICAEESTCNEYLQEADNKKQIAGYFNFNNDINDKSIHITEAAWPTMKAYNEKKNANRILELEKAVNEQRYVVDINEIWNTIKKGKGSILFVKNDLYLPAIIENETIQLVSKRDRNKKGVIDDIISEMIEENSKNRGEIAFMYNDELKKYNGLVLTVR